MVAHGSSIGLEFIHYYDPLDTRGSLGIKIGGKLSWPLAAPPAPTTVATHCPIRSPSTPSTPPHCSSDCSPTRSPAKPSADHRQSVSTVQQDRIPPLPTKTAHAFYATLAVATALGTAISLLPVDPIRALYWSAVINGVMVAPIIVVMMNLASSPRVMGRFTLSLWLKIVGWITAAVMALCVVGLFVSL